MEALKQAKRKQAEQRLRAGSEWNNEYDMVFTRDNGMFIRFKTLYVHFKNLVAKINRPEVRFHDIRHTFATNWIQTGNDVVALSRILGHTDPSFTYRTYCHPEQRSMVKGMADMESFLQVK